MEFFISWKAFYQRINECMQEENNKIQDPIRKAEDRKQMKQFLTNHIFKNAVRDNRVNLGKSYTLNELIFVHLNGVRRRYNDIPKKVCKIITHEVFHVILVKQNEITANHKWDLISYKFKEYGSD